MYRRVIGCVLVCVMLSALFCSGAEAATTDGPYSPTWKSLKKHPIPTWLKDAKFGIYFHWGPGTRRQIKRFKAKKWDPERWANLFRQAGARFAGALAKHHRGFVRWDSEYTTWDAVDRNPHRDIVGEMAEATRGEGMKFIATFHSAEHWENYEDSYGKGGETENPKYTGPNKLYPTPHEPGQSSGQEWEVLGGFPTPDGNQGGYMGKMGDRVVWKETGADESEAFLEDWGKEVKEVVRKYKPALLWFDYGQGDPSFEEVTRSVMAYYYNRAEEWNKEVEGCFKFMVYGTYLPRTAGILDIERGRNGQMSARTWMTDASIDKEAWGYTGNPHLKSANRLIDNLVDRVSKNGILLLSIAPKSSGVIPKGQKKRLRAMGKWLDVNGEAIYGTRPWKAFGEGPTHTPGGFKCQQWDPVSYTGRDVRFTVGDGRLYAICLGWPGEKITLNCVRDVHSRLKASWIDSISMLGAEGELEWSMTGKGLTIHTPEEKPCQHAFTFAIDYRAGRQPQVPAAIGSDK